MEIDTIPFVYVVTDNDGEIDPVYSKAESAADAAFCLLSKNPTEGYQVSITITTFCEDATPSIERASLLREQLDASIPIQDKSAGNVLFTNDGDP